MPTRGRHALRPVHRPVVPVAERVESKLAGVEPVAPAAVEETGSAEVVDLLTAISALPDHAVLPSRSGWSAGAGNEVVVDVRYLGKGEQGRLRQPMWSTRGLRTPGSAGRG